MHPDVPRGAALLLDFIGATETGKPGPEGYGVVYGHNQGKLKKPITSWTLDEVEADGPRRTKAYGSSAAGRYQFMRDTLDAPGTLRDIEGEMGLSGREVFSPALQDLMGYHLLKRRGYLDFVNKKITRITFGKKLAQEWASFPVLADTQGQKRKVKRGQSYYAGDGLNKSLVSPEKVEAVLADVLAAHTAAPVIPETELPADYTNLPPASGQWLLDMLKAALAFIINFIKGLRK
jgi:muramidase (phage lysozyme)